MRGSKATKCGVENKLQGVFDYLIYPKRLLRKLGLQCERSAGHKAYARISIYRIARAIGLAEIPLGNRDLPRFPGHPHPTFGRVRRHCR